MVGSCRDIQIIRNGVHLAGRLLLPGAPAPMPGVIFVHGLSRSKASPRNVVIATHLLDAGLAALLFDLSGHGESSADPRGATAYVDDVNAAFHWAEAQPQLDPNRLGIAGSSLGGVIAVEAVRRGLARPAAMVLRAPPLRMADWEALDIPSLVLIGSEDPLLPDVRAGVARCPAATLSVVAGAGHLFEEPGTLEEAVRLTVEWFRAQLAAPASDSPTGTRPALRVVADANQHGPLFRDRRDAGAQLGERFAETYDGGNVLVLGIPRGGVPVAAEVARRLRAELDVIVARKLGAPGYAELAIGAVTANGGRFLNEDIIRELAVSASYIDSVTDEQRAEARRREQRFREGRLAIKFTGRTVIIVDDGLATGATMRAAVRSVRRGDAARVVVAVPVGSDQACSALAAEADEVVCLFQPEPFSAVGFYYEHFEPPEDDEVQQILSAAHAQPRAAAHGRSMKGKPGAGSSTA